MIAEPILRTTASAIVATLASPHALTIWGLRKERMPISLSIDTFILGFAVVFLWTTIWTL